MNKKTGESIIYKLTQEERKSLEEEHITQEESNEIDKILDDMQEMLIVLS